MASIKRLTNKKNGLGLHRYRLRYYPYPGAKQKNETLWFRERAEAERYIALQQTKMIDSLISGIRWSEALDIWMQKAATDKNEGWVDAYEQIIREFTQPKYEVLIQHGRPKKVVKGWARAADVPVADTTRRMVSDFMDWRRDRRLEELKSHGKSPDELDGNPCANKARQVMLALTNKLRKEGVLPDKRFEFEGIPKRSTRKKRSKSYNPALLPEYLNVLPLEARLPVEWMLCTGWRSTPTCTLREADIDEINLIAYQVHKGKKERDEPLDETLLNILSRARELKRQKQEAFNTRRSQRRVRSEFVFVNVRDGEPWNHTSLRQYCQKKWKEAGLPVKKIHELRTTFGTEAGKQ